MTISEFTLRLLILLLPGVISALIIENLTIHKEWTQFRFSLYTLILGILCYLFFQLSYYFLSICFYFKDKIIIFYKLEFWDVLLNQSNKILLLEVFLSVLYGVLIGLLISSCIQKKYLHRFAQKTKISDKYGDENLFTFFLNAKETNWIWIRDKNKGLTFEGLRESFSETDNIREIVLRDVKVYDYYDSTFLYEIPCIYLSYPCGELTIEMSIFNEKENQNEENIN